jgi:putative transposase
MIDPDDQKLSVPRQCRILKLNRSNYYYKKQPVMPEELKLMWLIGEQYLKTLFWGSRSMPNHLCRLV